LNRIQVARPWKLVLAAVALLAATPCWAQDKVMLQLKWQHSFQSAGYYAALQQGYYRAAGLDVDMRPGGPDIDAMKVVQTGKAEFGVCTTSVLLEKPQDPQVTVLGVIYQHSPAILLVPSRAGISTLSDLKGHRIMDSPSDPDVAAMLKHEGVDYAALPRVDHNGDPRDLITGKADAFVAYSTNEPFDLGQLGTVPNLLAACLWLRLLRRQPVHLRGGSKRASGSHARLPRRQPQRVGLRAQTQGTDD
jgi:ABC-type nitrate/sulfonate/bicarbonate transport system substrate-binding protein